MCSRNILSGAMRPQLDTAGYLLLLLLLLLGLLFGCQLSNDWPLPLMTSVDVYVCVSLHLSQYRPETAVVTSGSALSFKFI